MSEPLEFERMAVAAPTGGYLFLGLTEEEAQAQRKALWDLISSIGKNVVNQKNLTNISLPVSVFEPRSYLQRLLDGWWAAPVFLKRAAAATDPVERFKLVMTFAVAGFHNTCAQLKPFNPILGETHQATFGDGTQIYCEQSSHHPPVTNFLVIGPKDSYKFYGFGEWHASFRGNTVKGHQRGPHFVEFPDGTVITYSLPWMNVHGIMYGDRIIEYDGTLDFRDEKNGLTCDLEINPKEEGGGFWSGWFSKNKLPSDYFKGQIVKVDQEAHTTLELSSLKKKGQLPEGCEVICDVQGSWLGCIAFGGEKMWDFQEDYTMYEPMAVKVPLPSDCRYRDDINALATGDKEKAAEDKVRLEEKQRREAKLRKEGEELRKKKEKHLAKQIKKGKAEKREPRIVKKPELKKEKSEKSEEKKKKKKDKKQKKDKKNEK